MLDERDLQAIAKLLENQKQELREELRQEIQEEIQASETRMKAYVEEQVHVSGTRAIGEIRASDVRMREQIQISESQTKNYVEDRLQALGSQTLVQVETALQDSKLETIDELQAAETRMKNHVEEKLQVSETQLRQDMRDIEAHALAVMEAYFEPKFQLSMEKSQLLEETTLREGDLEETEDRLDVLEVVVKQHSREIEALKKAQ